jgi:Methylase involved in ubiquinone/menaquinone biosynthesis
MDLFEGPAMAAGYAAARPAVHPQVVARIATRLGWSRLFGRALDVGCGAGASTRAMQPRAASVVGLDPVPAMVDAAASANADAQFMVGSAEALPIASGAVDIICAAGSLNFVDLTRFAAEAARVLTVDGVIAVYDFATGSRSALVPELAPVYEEFAARWPRPTGGRQVINPAVLASGPFTMTADDRFVVTIEMSADAYVDYLMTETNVAASSAMGEDRDGIRDWITATFAPVFASPIPIDFDAWFAILHSAAP